MAKVMGDVGHNGYADAKRIDSSRYITPSIAVQDAVFKGAGDTPPPTGCRIIGPDGVPRGDAQNQEYYRYWERRGMEESLAARRVRKCRWLVGMACSASVVGLLLWAFGG